MSAGNLLIDIWGSEKKKISICRIKYKNINLRCVDPIVTPIFTPCWGTNLHKDLVFFFFFSIYAVHATLEHIKSCLKAIIHESIPLILLVCLGLVNRRFLQKISTYSYITRQNLANINELTLCPK